MDTKIAVDLSQWLVWQDHIISATPVTVEITRQSFPGTRYLERCDGVELECIYVLGELPVLHRRSRICFRTANSECDWHMTSWYRRVAGSIEYDEVHIFGSHLILTLYSELNSWAHAQCDPKLRRLTMTIMEVGPPISNAQQPSEEE